jgi:hypothetical protein
MTYQLWRIAIVTLLLAAPLPALAQPLTVVELFQSQGCSSCPPANANVMALANRSDLLTLSFGVTYWDSLGWKDTFASPQYTARQWDYAHALHHKEVYTPQVVINGRADIVGSDFAALKALVAREGPVSGPVLAVNNRRASVAAGEGSAQVWLVRYDPNIVQVPVTRGENSGVTLPHRNVVKQLVKLGDWRGAAASYAIPAAGNPGWRDAIILQAGAGGPIIAAARG